MNRVILLSRSAAAGLLPIAFVACTDQSSPLAPDAATGPLSRVQGSAVQQCSVHDRSTDELLSGVTLTWTSSFLCANAPDAGSYELTVDVSNATGSREAVRIENVRLHNTTPRPRGQAPQGTADDAGLPITVSPGETESFRITGTYTLVRTDEGKKANLHIHALGEGVSSQRDFRLGINALFRGSGAVEEGTNGSSEAGPPSGRPGGGPPFGPPPGRGRGRGR